jgi:DNA-binding XRE family transcriptional regulator
MNGVVVMTEFERLRIRAGLTVAQMSLEAQISRSTIEKIEKNIPVRAPLASRACNVLGRHLGYEITIESIGIKTV